ncbi:hypothetical protein [Streptomyces sp. NPDC048623]|uniref:hypothetical protein n=1 Tax=Streptomyces sp. NPDC048623 TaxID=3155761 RepID=UPI0034167783
MRAYGMRACEIRAYGMRAYGMRACAICSYVLGSYRVRPALRRSPHPPPSHGCVPA